MNTFHLFTSLQWEWLNTRPYAAFSTTLCVSISLFLATTRAKSMAVRLPLKSPPLSSLQESNRFSSLPFFNGPLFVPVVGEGFRDPGIKNPVFLTKFFNKILVIPQRLIKGLWLVARCPVPPPHPVGQQLPDGIKQEMLAFRMFLKDTGPTKTTWFWWAAYSALVQAPKPTWPNGYWPGSGSCQRVSPALTAHNADLHSYA